MVFSKNSTCIANGKISSIKKQNAELRYVVKNANCLSYKKMAENKQITTIGDTIYSYYDDLAFTENGKFMRQGAQIIYEKNK